jgi:mannose-6-phosphate isomerase-like protein (cupin superfamily)
MKIASILLLQFIATCSFAQLKPIESGVIHWNDLPVKKGDMRESRKLAEGTTPEFDYFEIHATTQEKGAAPRPAHTQKDREEMIIIKEGSMKCTIGDKTAVLGAGSVLLIPPLQSQTFENAGNGPLTTMFLFFIPKKEWM